MYGKLLLIHAAGLETTECISLSLSLSNEYIVAMWTRIKSFRKNETVEKNVYAHAYAETGRNE